MEAEGGYTLVNNRHDRGGLTFCGISRRWNPSWEGWEVIDNSNWKNKLKELIKLTDNFYKQQYWNKIKGNDISSQRTAEYIFKDCVLSGLINSIKQVQKVIGVDTDGVFGNKSLKALNDFIEFNENVLLSLLAIDEIIKYAKIVRRDSTQDKFFNGWIYRTLQSAGFL